MFGDEERLLLELDLGYVLLLILYFSSGDNVCVQKRL